jgi:hypothetical protein
MTAQNSLSNAVHDFSLISYNQLLEVNVRGMQCVPQSDAPAVGSSPPTGGGRGRRAVGGRLSEGEGCTGWGRWGGGGRGSGVVADRVPGAAADGGGGRRKRRLGLSGQARVKSNARRHTL